MANEPYFYNNWCYGCPDSSYVSRDGLYYCKNAAMWKIIVRDFSSYNSDYYLSDGSFALNIPVSDSDPTLVGDSLTSYMKTCPGKDEILAAQKRAEAEEELQKKKQAAEEELKRKQEEAAAELQRKKEQAELELQEKHAAAEAELAEKKRLDEERRLAQQAEAERLEQERLAAAEQAEAERQAAKAQEIQQPIADETKPAEIEEEVIQPQEPAAEQPPESSEDTPTAGGGLAGMFRKK